jgi:D-inositol-3-phosphate glycosyltransferase
MPRVALLTGGGDKPYAIGMATSLSARHVPLDFIGSDELNVPEVRALPGLRFLNLRGDQNPDAHTVTKMVRILLYYTRLIRYAMTAQPSVFHVLWNNKFEFFDRTVLALFYRMLGKRIVRTVHNVNAAQRDGGDGPLNRLTLRIQYALADHLFVHTEEMRRQLQAEFDVPAHKVTTIPFGINNTVPTTSLTREEARLALGLSPTAKVILFFGSIAPYKGLEYAVQALPHLIADYPDTTLLIAGRPKFNDGYWPDVDQVIERLGLRRHTVEVAAHIPDEDVERYFKAADVLVLPYTHVFQSGVLFLGYNFGLPAVVSDIGGMKNEVLEGVTGFVCRSKDSAHLAEVLDRYFRSPLYVELENRRSDIRRLMTDRNSWERVSEETCRIYRSLWNPEGRFCSNVNA